MSHFRSRATLSGALFLSVTAAGCGNGLESATEEQGGEQNWDFATTSTGLRRCGTSTPSPAIRDRVETDFAPYGDSGRFQSAATTEIPVHFHVLQASSGVGNGELPDSMLDAQITVLNSAYASAGFHFT